MGEHPVVETLVAMAAWLAPGCAAAAAGGVDVDEHGSTQPPGLGGMPVAVDVQTVDVGKGNARLALFGGITGSAE